jgi:hypothetical protein
MKLGFLIVAFLAALQGFGAEPVRVAPWEFHDSFWMSLHQTLMDNVMSKAPQRFEGAPAEEQAAWNEAVEEYRRAAPGRGDISFSRAMEATTFALSRIADDAPHPPDDAPVVASLRKAAPIYRKFAWQRDSAANRFFIAYAAAMLREAAPALIRRHEAVYRTPWPAKVLIYITPVAGPFGAYTLAEKEGVVTTMSCRDEGYQGFRALEMAFHEASHAVVDVNHGTVADAIAGAAKRHGVAIPPNLWHALLFETSGELTRRYLAERGITAFVPSSVELFTRAWPQYRDAVQKFWLPYLSGQGTLEDAVDKIVAAVGRK